MKTNGSSLNGSNTPEFSHNSYAWETPTPAKGDRISELELELNLLQAKQNYLEKTQAILDRYGAEMLQLMAGQTPSTSSPESEIVFGSSGGRDLLIQTLEKAQNRAIVVCPWLSRRSIDRDLILKIRALCDRGCRLDIGWGYQHDIGKLIKISRNGQYYIDAPADLWQNYSALPVLHEIQASYPHLFRLKLLGTHAKYWVCDDKFAYVGSHNVLSSNLPPLNSYYPDLAGNEVGTLHKSRRNIQKLSDRFDSGIGS